MPLYINRLVVTTLFLFFCLSSHSQNLEGVSVRTVVIDAGHGGHDPGCVFGSYKEKDINLDVALAVGERIKKGFPDVKVIYTRTRDVFVPLVNRSAIANRNKADLFISVHVNSAGSSSSARGTETFLMGTDKSRSNMELCRRENSVITLEKDYSTKYADFNPEDVDSYIFFNLMQSAQFEQSISLASMVEDNFMQSGPIKYSRGIKQAPLLVLWQTTMPSVLVELGFLSNSSDRKLLTSKDSREKMADCIYAAFRDYKKKYDPDDVETVPADTVDVTAVADKTVAETQPKVPAGTPVKTTAVSPADTLFRVQILATAKKIGESSPELKGEKKIECVFINGYYKYWVGKFKTRSEAAEELKRLKSKFSGAFIVRTDASGNVLK